MSKILHFHQSFKDPWNKAHAWNLREDFEPEDLLEGGHVRYDPNKLDAGQKAKIQAEAAALKAAGRKSFEAADQNIDEEGKQKKAELMDGLKEFQRVTGIPQEDALKKIEACNTKWGLEKLKKALQKSGLEYVEKKLIAKHAVFQPKDGLEGTDKPSLEANKNHYLSWAKTLPLFAERDEDSLAKFIKEFPDFIKPRLAFREKLDKQTPFVQKLFYQKLNKAKAIDPGASEPGTLEALLAEIKEVMNAPQPAQVEFKKGEKSQKSPKERADAIMSGFNERMGKYLGLLQGNMALFGGKMVQTPQGPMRTAAKEFLEWMTKRENFADMDKNIKLFQTQVVPERKAVYSRRDELLAHLPEAARNKMQEKTNEMRFHSLQAYIKDLEGLTKTTSVHALEYIADVEGTMFENMNVFNEEERSTFKRRIQVQLPERQEGELERLHSVDIAERVDAFKEYQKLPPHLKDDKRFADSNIFDKERYLKEARRSLAEEEQNPFAIKDATVGDKRAKEKALIQRMHSERGRQVFKKAMEGMKEAEGFANVAEVTNRVGKTWKNIESGGLTQMEYRMQEDAKWGLRGYDKEVYKVGFGLKEARSDKDQMYGNTFVTDALWRLAKTDRRSGGAVESELQVVDHNAWMNGDDSIVDALDDAAYDEMAMFTGVDGKDELHLTQENRKAFETLFKILANLLKKDFGLDGASSDVVAAMNSSILEVDDSFASAAEFNDFDIPEPANNSEGFSNQMAA